jgi:hypothetical protein
MHRTQATGAHWTIAAVDYAERILGILAIMFPHTLARTVFLKRLVDRREVLAALMTDLYNRLSFLFQYARVFGRTILPLALF